MNAKNKLGNKHYIIGTRYTSTFLTSPKATSIR